MVHFELTQCQKDAYFNVNIDVANMAQANNNNIMRVINGYAGTGKTTLAPMFIREFASSFKNIMVMAPTNKAVSVIQDKMLKAGVNCNFSTIHSFAYGKPNKYGYFVRKSDMIVHDCFVIVDEASMISKQVDEDLKKCLKSSYILYLGDDFQLEQIGEPSDIFSYPTSVMNTVMRHDNGILNTATILRKNKRPVIQINDDVFKMRGSDPLKDICKSLEKGEDSIYLVSTNKKRVEVNKEIRKRLGFLKDITRENLICINNNTYFSNGETFQMADPIKKGDFELVIPNTRQIISGGIYIDQDMTIMYVDNYDKPSLYTAQLYELPLPEKISLFGIKNIEEKYFISKDVVICTLGYAISTHKSQGSQFENVYIDFDFCSPKWDPRRWLYTAVTRATKEVNLLPSKYFDFI